MKALVLLEISNCRFIMDSLLSQRSLYSKQTKTQRLLPRTALMWSATATFSCYTQPATPLRLPPTVFPMGTGASRIYSALAQSPSGQPLARPEPHPNWGLVQEPAADPLEVLRECEGALRSRPARLRRNFVCPAERGPAHQRPIRVMQWNILAQALAEGIDNFVHCPPDVLNWAERKYLILEEILIHDPDIMCLQEVDHYFDTFQPVLASLGYHCSFCPKPRSPCLDVAGNSGPDGCALLFRRARFTLLRSTHLRLEADGRHTNQVAVVQTLRCRATGRTLCVATTHLKAHGDCAALRSAQGDNLLQNLQAFAKAGVSAEGEAAPGVSVPLVVCGDFNAEPSEDVYLRFATSPLGLDSVFKLLSNDRQTEPPFTTWKIRATGEACHTLDYVWYSRGALRVDSLLALPTEEQIGPGRLPSVNYPSDHLSLVCDLRFREPAELDNGHALGPAKSTANEDF